MFGVGFSFLYIIQCASNGALGAAQKEDLPPQQPKPGGEKDGNMFSASRMLSGTKSSD